jgi:hypothetical protein
MSITRLFGFLFCLSPVALPHVAVAQGRLYQSRHYDIHTDLEPEAAQEAVLRMTRMFEEYSARTQGSFGHIARPLPFYIFTKPQDYYANGGRPGSVGVFMGDKLMAIAGQRVDDQTWHVIQHEGFHQFVHAVIRGDVPIWINEGLAEYFGNAVFTGDGFVTGIIPPDRLQRVKRMIQQHRSKTIEEMMTLSHWQWNAELNMDNYDMAWSMIHFLGHADDGRYQIPFQKFLRDVSWGKGYERSWLRNFGAGTAEFEARWRDYWQNLPDNAMADRYVQATTATLTSFLARACTQRQRFATVDDFFKAARDGTLKSDPDDWLPPSLLEKALAKVDESGEWFLRNPNAREPSLVCRMKDGTEVIGRFELDGLDVGKVTTEIKSKKKDRRTERRRHRTRQPGEHRERDRRDRNRP